MENTNNGVVIFGNTCKGGKRGDMKQGGENSFYPYNFDMTLIIANIIIIDAQK